MVIWVTEIQGDEFQQSFRKYEGLDSSLNSVPTMNVQLWMTYAMNELLFQSFVVTGLF